MKRLTSITAWISAAILLLPVQVVRAADTPGVTATEIKLGQTMPYSGPASAFSVVGKVNVAYMNMINEQGGINGRKINLISRDDSYSPPKTVEQVRRLVEEDNVLAMFYMTGSPSVIATAKYLNGLGVPQLLSSSGSSIPANVKEYPYTTMWSMPFRVESTILAKYILKNKPDAKIGILFQNDEFGKGYQRFFKQALGDKAASMVVVEAGYDITSPTIDSQVAQLKGSGADTVVLAASPKFSAQAFRKMYELNWNPLKMVINAGSSIPNAIKPAGREATQGILSVQFMVLPDDQANWELPAMKEYFAFMKKYVPGENPYDNAPLSGYITSQLMVEILKKCGNDLSRENVMKAAQDFPEVPHPLLLPGVTYNATPTDHTPHHTGVIAKIEGERWANTGEVIRVDLPQGE